jgi:hypothetical protein
MSALLKAPRVEVPRLPHTALPWRVGRPGCVVSDHPVPKMGGSDDIDYYGGHMVAESITKDNAAFIAQACTAFPQLLHALEMIRDADDDCRRDSRPCMPLAARATVDAALASAVPK